MVANVQKGEGMIATLRFTRCLVLLGTFTVAYAQEIPRDKLSESEALGWDLTGAQAKDMEARLEQNPNDAHSRASLIGWNASR